MNNTDVFKSYFHKQTSVSWSYKDLVLIFLVLTLFQFASGFVLGFLNAILSKSKAINISSYYFPLFYISYFCFFVWLIFYKYKISIESIGLIKDKIRFKDSLLGVLSAIIIQYAHTLLIHFYPHLSDTDYLKYFDFKQTNLVSIVTSGIVIIFLVPIMEEIFFRGLLFQKLKDNFSLGVALIIQSFLFP